MTIAARSAPENFSAQPRCWPFVYEFVPITIGSLNNEKSQERSLRRRRIRLAVADQQYLLAVVESKTADLFADGVECLDGHAA